MAKFFKFYPKTPYVSNTSSSGVEVVTNIIARFAFENKLKENANAFYKYTIKDSDNPEIIARKIYGNSERHWIVLLFNDIIDPQFDWPLKYETFTRYVDEKYSTSDYADTANTSVSGLSWAQNVSNVQSYYKVITRTSADGTQIQEKLEVDANTYANIGTSQVSYTLSDSSTIVESITTDTKTYYDYENELNEAKREIKILKEEFVSQVEKEFKRVISL